MTKTVLRLCVGMLLLMTLLQLGLHFFYFSKKNQITHPIPDTTKPSPPPLSAATTANTPIKKMVLKQNANAQSDQYTTQFTLSPGDSLPFKLATAGVSASQSSSAVSDIMEVMSVKHLNFSKPLLITLSSKQPITTDPQGQSHIPNNTGILVTVNPAENQPVDETKDTTASIPSTPTPPVLPTKKKSTAKINNKPHRMATHALKSHHAHHPQQTQPVYTIQLAANQSPYEAKKIAKALSPQGHLDILYRSSWYKVTAGRYHSYTRAKKALHQQQKKHPHLYPWIYRIQ